MRDPLKAQGSKGGDKLGEGASVGLAAERRPLTRQASGYGDTQSGDERHTLALALAHALAYCSPMPAPTRAL